MTLWLLGLLLLRPQAPVSESPITVVVRVFDGIEEVSSDARVQVFTAGARDAPVATHYLSGKGLTASVPAGMYDIQVVHQRDGKVLNIRWAVRLLIIRYPDEPGEHLEVINLKPGFGAVQLKMPTPQWPPDLKVSIHAPGDRIVEAGKIVFGDDYALFVVPAGKYDLLVRRGTESSVISDVDVPLERTRLKNLPGPEQKPSVPPD